MRQIGTRGVYGNAELPDFMVFLNWKELPWYWWGFEHFAFAALMVAAGARACWRFVFGWFAFRSRVTGVYLSIITQALTYVLLLAFFRNDMGFGGNNGLTDFKELLGFEVQAPGNAARPLRRLDHRARRSATSSAASSSRSKLGRVLLALRDAESRVRFLGYSVDLREALRLHRLGDARRHRRRALRAAGRHHQPERVLARPTRSRSPSGSRSAAAARWSARCSAPCSSMSPRPGSPAPCPTSGSSCSARSSSLVTLAFPRGVIGVAQPAPRPAAARAAAPLVEDDRADERRKPRRSIATVAARPPAALSRRRHRQLRRVQGAERPVAARRRRRAAQHHRPERRRQDDDDGRHHRQDPAGFGQGVLRRQRRPDPARRGRHRQSRHRPQVPEADRVREPDRVRESGAGAEERARHLARAVGDARARQQRDRIAEMLDDDRARPAREHPRRHR